MTPDHVAAERVFLLRHPQGDARLEYVFEGTKVIFTHTFVPAARRGQGLAEELVKAGLAWAKLAGHPVGATCSYVQTYLLRHPQS